MKTVTVRKTTPCALCRGSLYQGDKMKKNETTGASYCFDCAHLLGPRATSAWDRALLETIIARNKRLDRIAAATASLGLAR